LSLILSVILIIGILPVNALAETRNAFVLVAESGGKLVIAPEYIEYSEGQTVRQALLESEHSFLGLEDGWITEIDGVGGNYTRSDEFGDEGLNKPASEVKYYRFSEELEGKPNEGLQSLMTAMADYKDKNEDVKAAAKEIYDQAQEQFVGLGSEAAKVLADLLNDAITSYEMSQSGTKHSVTFLNGTETYQGASIQVKNGYGKTWTDDGDGVFELPEDSYSFRIEQDGVGVEGSIQVTGSMNVVAALPETTWLNLDAFRLSGSYGAEDNEDNKFSDDEYVVGEWEKRTVTVPVVDTFTGTVYSYIEYDKTLFSTVPQLKALYQPAKTEEKKEQVIPFESYTSGAVEALTKGSAGNTVIYRVSYVEEDGYTYFQDYTVEFARIPTLTGIRVEDEQGTGQAATEKFDSNKTEYTYKILDEVKNVMISAAGMDDSYKITINGQNAKEGVSVPVSETGDTIVEVKVSADKYENIYTLTIQPGEGKSLNFITTDSKVTLEVVNSNGEVLSYKKYLEGSNGNRYQYTLVPGENYCYVATAKEYYHVTDEFSLEDVANSTIKVEVPTEDWLTSLAFGTSVGPKSKGNLTMDSEFKEADHKYQIEYVDTEHLAYVWVSGSEDVSIHAMYDQVYSGQIYHGKEMKLELVSDKMEGVQLKRFLMDENPIENELTIRLTKESDGVTYYQDYQVDFKRLLTLKEISAACEGLTAMLVQKDGTTGYDSDVKEYSVTVSMAAPFVEFTFSKYDEKRCYGESEVGYRIFADGKDVTEQDKVGVLLDGTIQTQTVTITVENEKAPNGSSDYVIHILKSPPVDVSFVLNPEDALLSLYESMSGERLWPKENNVYQLCEGYSYQYSFTEYGYVGKTGIISVMRDETEALVVTDGTEKYIVTESADGGGEVIISWGLEKAEDNPAINTEIKAEWDSFRGNQENNAVTDAAIPIAAEGGTLYWAHQIGKGFDSDAVGSPIIVDGDLITYAGSTIYRIDTVTGEILKTGGMDHKSSFAITPPVYAEGMVFVALSNGTVQAFNANTLESLWIYKDPLGGQPNCPLTVKNGYIYTGFWNSETGDANFVCLTITDENPSMPNESKSNSWYYTQAGGYYWAGAYVSDDFVIVGTDDGTNKRDSQTSQLLLFQPKTGELLDSLEGLNGDIRSTVVYDISTDAYYFTSKGGSFYCVKVDTLEQGWSFTECWSVALSNGSESIPMSTCSPVVYNGRAYVGVSGAGQFSAYSGHNITVIDLAQKKIAYSVETQGYPQTSGLLTTAYEEENGYVYIYYFDNMTPGKIRVLRDKAGQTQADYLTTEENYTTAYALFTPTGNQAQYAICSPIVDEYGTIYFKNDSAYLMAYGSMIEKIEITKNPDKMIYADGEEFDPEGMIVTATYENGKTRDVTDYVTITADPITTQNQIVTISFEHVMYHNMEDGTEMKSGIQTTTPVTVIQVELKTEEEDPIEEILYGDLNGDGQIDIGDANIIAGYYNEILELSEEQKEAADVNNDGRIDISDANMVSAFYNEVIESFPERT